MKYHAECMIPSFATIIVSCQSAEPMAQCHPLETGLTDLEHYTTTE